MNPQSAMTALIQNQLGQTLNGVGKDILDIRTNEGDSLLGQLTGRR